MTKKGTTFRTSKGVVVSVTYPDIYIQPGYVVPADVTNPTEMRETLRRELINIVQKGGGAGFEYATLFNKRGYTPHYAEHVVDPTDGKEKLVMADPHTQHKAFIYDLDSAKVEWEVTVPGSMKSNPHTAHMFMENVSGFGEAGDIYCTDRDNKIIVIDRATKAVKFSKSVPWAAQVVHTVILGVNKDSVIVTDYTTGHVAKLSLPNLGLVWSRTDIVKPAKVSIIEGYAEPLHSPSYGGQYLLASNDDHGGVFEIRDLDGTTVWRSLQADYTGPWIVKNHSAFRMARGESYGNVTVVGSEGGGGVYGIDYLARIVWGIPSSFAMFDVGGGFRRSINYANLVEITHVFPTLDSKIGFISWSGENSSIVGVISQLPVKQEGHYILAWNKISTDAWAYLAPPIEACEWDETLVVIKNTGVNSLNWKLDAYPIPLVYLNTAPADGLISLQPSRTVAAAAFDSAVYIHPYKLYRIAVQSTTPGSATAFGVYIVQRRG